MKGKLFKLIAMASVVGLFATQPVTAGENEVVIGFAPPPTTPRTTLANSIRPCGKF